MRILYVTTIVGTMSFFKTEFKHLIEQGHTVEIACNMTDNTRFDAAEFGIKAYHIPFSRSPFSVDNIRAYNMIKELVRNNQYDIVHCHTPNAAAISRLACRKSRKNGIRVIYTSHGFHFYKGAPKKNWLLYYPVECLCAHWTDTIITINSEDYELAKRKLKAKNIEYVPGVGVQIEKFRDTVVDRKKKREEINIPSDAFMLLTVGELNDNKNQITIIRALGKINNPNFYYVLAGKGAMESSFVAVARELGISDRVRILGYRTDVNELYHIADAFCFPSKREGLGLGAVEAMLAGIPIITSNVHGINDYSQEGITGFKCGPLDIDGFAKAINRLADNTELRNKMGIFNKKYAEKYDVNRIIQMIDRIYGV